MDKEKLEDAILEALQPVFIENVKDLQSGDISPLHENVLSDAVSEIASVLLEVREYNK